MEDELFEAAKNARMAAYAPYSRFLVGAAVLANGRMFAGCNVENASYGLTNCAERTAIFNAVSAGCHNIEAIAVVTDTETPVSPCGACRQVIAEFSPGHAPVYTANLAGVRKTWTVASLLPDAFKGNDIPKTTARHRASISAAL